MKCDELKAYKGDVTIPVYGTIADADVYLKKDVDAAIAELKADINNVLIQNRELCQALQAMYSAEEYTNLQAENAELKQKLENVNELLKASKELLQEWADNASKQIRKLKRALWLSRADRAHKEVILFRDFSCLVGKEFKWRKIEKLCRAKAEEYK